MNEFQQMSKMTKATEAWKSMVHLGNWEPIGMTGVECMCGRDLVSLLPFAGDISKSPPYPMTSFLYLSHSPCPISSSLLPLSLHRQWLPGQGLQRSSRWSPGYDLPLSIAPSLSNRYFPFMTQHSLGVLLSLLDASSLSLLQASPVLFTRSWFEFANFHSRFSLCRLYPLLDVSHVLCVLSDHLDWNGLQMYRFSSGCPSKLRVNLHLWCPTGP